MPYDNKMKQVPPHLSHHRSIPPLHTVTSAGHHIISIAPTRFPTQKQPNSVVRGMSSDNTTIILM
ncbi:MAG: hypothetical protein ACPGC9_00460 [Cytophagales bacterium]